VSCKEFSGWNQLYQNIETLADDDLNKILSHLNKAATERRIDLSPSNDTSETTQDQNHAGDGRPFALSTDGNT
jgi:hypothetical protein